MTGGRPSRESLREVKREYRRRRRRRLFGRRRLRLVQPDRPRRLRGPGTTLGGVALIVAMLAFGVWVTGGLPERPREAAAPVPVVVPTPTPTAKATVPPVTDPFFGSKVMHWPVGAAGLVAPEARPVGSFPAKQVRAAYDATLRYLRAAMLDERVLYDADLRPVLATLDPDTVKGRAPSTIANVFPDDIAMASREVRVNGLLTPRVVRGELHVEFTYVGVYALRPAGPGRTELVAIRRAGTTLFRREGAGISRTWLYLSYYTSDHSVCGAKWPDTSLHVRLGREREEVSRSPVPETTHSFNLLDPRATEPPPGCFDNTGEL